MPSAVAVAIAVALLACRSDVEDPMGNTGPGGTVARIDLVGGRLFMVVGDTTTFTARARDNAGNVLPGVTFHWTSSTPAALAVDPVTGHATALATGMSNVQASAGSALSNVWVVHVNP